MKDFISISLFLLSNNADAFSPPAVSLSNTIATASSFKVSTLASTTDDIISDVRLKGEMLKEDTDSKTTEGEEKWKVKETSEKVEEAEEVTVAPKITDPKLRVQTGRYDDLEMSIAVPFLKRPTKLDGTHAGDIGFDPLGFTESNDLYTMMEAEIRHSRLAMLAVIGWPLSELIAPEWMLQGSNHLAPSVLNGFNPLSFFATLVAFGALGYFEYATSLRQGRNTELGRTHAEDMSDVWSYGVPGDYNFDPLNLYSSFGDDAAGRKAMRELEVAHGRAAMLGIAYFALWEAMSGVPIVENNLLFQPNLLVPLLGVLYLGIDFFLDIENTDQYLLQIQLSSEGQMRLTRLQNFLNRQLEKSGVNEGSLDEKDDAAGDFIKMLKSKVDKVMKE